MNITSLYSLIKEQVRQKGRPLKIIANWDETLFSFRATAIHKFSNSDLEFKQFFKEFWEHASVKVKDGSSANKVFSYEGNDEKIKEASKKFIEIEENKKKNPKAGIKSLIEAPDMHILTISEELLQCLKEGLISELVFVTTTRTSEKGKMSSLAQSKEKRFAKNFGQFPQCKLGIMMVKRINGQNKPHRWEWIRDNHPDFDVYVDDDSGWITSINQRFPNRIYIMPNYKANLHIQGDNFFHVKQEVSDLTDQDFSIAALELKTKQLEQNLIIAKAERKRKRVYCLLGGVGVLLLVFLLVLFRRKRKK